MGSRALLLTVQALVLHFLIIDRVLVGGDRRRARFRVRELLSYPRALGGSRDAGCTSKGIGEDLGEM